MEWAALSPHSILDYNGPPTLAHAYTVVFSKAAVYAAVFIVAWAVVVLALRAAGCGPDICGARRGTWALKSAMLMHHGIITPLAFIAISEDPTIMGMYTCFGCREVASLMNRATVAPLAARALAPVTLGYFIGDLLLLSQWNLTTGSAVESALMLFHHVASLLVWPAAIYFDWVARYVLIMLSYEFTSGLLTLMWMISTAGYKKSPVYMVCGLLFTISFVLMRMIGAIPQLLALWHATPWLHSVETAASPEGIHEWCWIFSSSLVAPHLLNLFWGIKVVQGFLAIIFGKKGGDKTGKSGKDA